MATNNDGNMQFLNSSNVNYNDLEGEINAPGGGGGGGLGSSASGSGSASFSKSSKSPAALNIQPVNDKQSTSLNLGYDSSNGDPKSYRPDLVSTLDEPVSVTIMRDLKAVGYKFGHVFFPKKSNVLLRDWDLWGPLSLCVLLSILLQGNVQDKNAPEFASLFALFTLGAIVVTVNTKLLSGKLSFFQSICVLGYCLLPLVLAELFHKVLLLISGPSSVFSFGIQFAVVVFSCVWSVFASTAFLAADTINLTDRKALAVFPIFLFYFVISWLVILDTN